MPVFLFGHSLGGLVTATSVVRDTSGVAGVILSSALLRRGEGPLLRFLAYTLGTITPGLGLA